MKEFNLKHLVSCQINDKYESRHYQIFQERIYRDWISHWGKKITRKLGIYLMNYYENPEFICDVELFNSSKLSSTHILVDGIIYEKYEIVFYFSNDDKNTVLFDSMEEAEQYKKEILAKATVFGCWVGLESLND